jgi:hypothetical protein
MIFYLTRGAGAPSSQVRPSRASHFHRQVAGVPMSGLPLNASKERGQYQDDTHRSREGDQTVIEGCKSLREVAHVSTMDAPWITLLMRSP